ncbi:MAG TPA: hypothetical protein VMZ53_03865 [Kofleriaceae bacterium]|nr:hypothetical protein [Kofleriaceae bacterium]
MTAGRVQLSSDGPRVFYPQCRAILQVIFDGYGASVRDSEILVIPVLPKSVTVHINSYKQADSYEMVFDAGDLPIDPRLIRAGAAEIYLFQAPSADDRTRVISRRQPLVDADPGGLRRRDPVQTLALEMGTEGSRDKFTLGERKPRIAGPFDDTDIELSSSGKWVTIKGQDYTAFLTAIQYPPNPNGTARRIPTGRRLDLIVDSLLEEADPDRQLSVDVRGFNPAEMPIVGAKETRGNKRGIPVEQGTSYWDVIYKLVERHGFICYVDGLDVVISRPKTITDRDTPNIKRMAWGKNLEHLSMRRHLGKEQAPTIVVKSYDERTGKTLTAEYPDGSIDRAVIIDSTKGGKPKVHRRVKESTRRSKKTGKVKTTIRERDEYQIVQVNGITDPAALKRIAENRYHLLGKAERSVTATTRDLHDLRFADILNVSAGDAFWIEWDEFNRELLANPKVSEEQKVRHLELRGFNSEIAREVAKRYELLAGLDRPLRFKEGTIEFDVEDGIKIEMELQDFMVVEGIRSDSGATRTPLLQQKREQQTKAGGKPIGWSEQYRKAQQRRWQR